MTQVAQRSAEVPGAREKRFAVEQADGSVVSVVQIHPCSPVSTSNNKYQSRIHERSRHAHGPEGASTVWTDSLAVEGDPNWGLRSCMRKIVGR